MPKVISDIKDFSTKINNNIDFGYTCDDFQLYAFNSIENNIDVLITAHTGSGKTTIAEYAVINTTRILNKKVIYTSPIKSLSNEKYNDFKHKYPDLNIGIMTGDNKINQEGNCVIMTAEILRNMLFLDTQLIDLECVILDEVHYINDIDRGKVWEEIIVLLPQHVTLVMLSATIDNEMSFAQWVCNTRNKNISLISTCFRKVPLVHTIFANNKLHKIFDTNDNIFIQHNIQYDVNKSPFDKLRTCINYLIKNDMNQTIFFVFSKNSCEKYAHSLYNIGLGLVDSDEIIKINNIFNLYMHKNNYNKIYEHLEQYNTVLKLVNIGVCFHHSGLVPILKEIVELLFKEKLIKILFATETFAVGVNMPTRTVVFTSLEKPTNGTKRLLTSSEYKQMSGRAGRRGVDILGNVIILPLYDEYDNITLKTIITGKSNYIQSRLSIDYSFVLKCTLANNDIMSKTLYYKEHQEHIEGMVVDINRLSQQIKHLNTNTIYDKLIAFEQNTEFKKTKKQLEEHKKLTKNINKTDYNIYKEYKSQIDIYNTLVYKHSICTKYINNQTNKVTQILKELGYINTENELTVKGKIASQINECSCLIMTELIISDIFDNIDIHELVGLIGLFVDDGKEYDTINNKVMNDNNVIKIHNIINHIKDIESVYDIDNTYILNYDFYEYAFEWSKFGTNSFECLGTFVRQMLKINNILNNVTVLLEQCEKHHNIPKIVLSQKSIIKEYVNTYSLFL